MLLLRDRVGDDYHRSAVGDKLMFPEDWRCLFREVVVITLR